MIFSQFSQSSFLDAPIVESYYCVFANWQYEGKEVVPMGNDWYWDRKNNVLFKKNAKRSS